MADEKWRESWTKTKGAKEYGDLFFKRATGDAAEMESSKAAALRVAPQIRAGDTVCDIGCGAGHYLVSLKSATDKTFNYIGVDATDYYVSLGQKAYQDKKNISFKTGDIFDLPLEDQSSDVTMCNNVLLHLPSVQKPISELIRVTERFLLIRTLIGTTSCIIKHVDPASDGDEFEGSDPKGFHFLNIYSENYLRHLLKDEGRITRIHFETDKDFDPGRLADTGNELAEMWDATRAVNGMQISGYVVQPWTWLSIELGN